MTLGRKTQLTVAITTANSLLQILLLQVILTTKAIINPEFFAKLADIFETDLSTVMSNYELALPAIHATMLFVCVIVLTAQLIEFFEVRKLSRA
ncbi:hypothetical protein JV173_00975 [Acholeplasma equirhinis]|uniref:hypothetical protein n=1 Tax=Acholeplasma equirhinis TaxID=555393 RepID=UPI00197A7B78|nr:hypothetical protein [Acholeplasma equirhinis]MBN3490077.1 hypothetical protein [Acholeplasma equirhinis]